MGVRSSQRVAPTQNNHRGTAKFRVFFDVIHVTCIRVATSDISRSETAGFKMSMNDDRRNDEESSARAVLGVLAIVAFALAIFCLVLFVAFG
jgi:hypothetical protein